jgi:hypothetical protein
MTLKGRNKSLLSSLFLVVRDDVAVEISARAEPLVTKGTGRWLTMHLSLVSSRDEVLVSTCVW